MTLSQNMVDVIKKSKQQAFEIQVTMGFKPMMLEQVIVQLIKHQSSKPLNFRL